jgi:hypothetical protein
MSIKPGILVERTFGEGKRPVGIVISKVETVATSGYWLVQWNRACPARNEIMHESNLKVK